MVTRSSSLSSLTALVRTVVAASILGALAPARPAPVQGPACYSPSSPPTFHAAWGGEVRKVFALPDPGNPSNQYVWRAEDGNRIRYSVDAGATWQTATTPDSVRTTLLDIFFLDVTHGWAVGPNGVVLGSTDGGASWNVVGSTVLDAFSNPAELWAVRFTSTSRGYIAGEKVFKYTTNGGTSWTTVNLFLDSALTQSTPMTDWEFYSIDIVQLSGNFLGLASDQGVGTNQGIVFKSTDGLNWYRVGGVPAGVPNAFEAWVVDIEPSPSSTSTASAFLAGGTSVSPGRIFSSTDGGSTWTEEFHDCTVNFVCPINGCSSGDLWSCKDHQLQSFATIYGLTTLDHTHAIACSYGGGIFQRQTSSPVYWLDLSDRCNMTGPLLSLSSTSSQTAWLVGTFGSVQKTTNGGSSFSSQNANGGLPLRFHDVAFLSASTGWGVGEGATIMKTTDGGCTFALDNAQFCPTVGGNLRGISVAGSNGVAVGDGGTIFYRTASGTPAWQEVTPHPTTANLRGVEHVGTSEFWAVGDNSTVLRSTNNGVTWSAVGATGLPSGIYLHGIGLVDSNNGFVVGLQGSSGVAYRVRNASTTPSWGSVTPSCSPAIPELLDVDTRGTPVSSAEVYAVGRGGAVLKWNPSTNVFECVSGVYTPSGCSCSGGTALTTSDLNTIELVTGSSDIYIGGDAGTVLRYTTSTGWTKPKGQTTKDILGFSFVSATQGYAVGQAQIQNADSDNNGDSLWLLVY